MAITISLGGVDRTNYCDLKSVYITDTIQANADTMDMAVSLSSTEGWRPKAGNVVIVTNGTGKEFAGVVEAITEELRGPSRLRFMLSCRDYNYLFDKYVVVDESTQNLSGDTWVTRIINGFTTGFTGANVSTGPTLAPQRFDYMAASDAVRLIADKSSYGWYIDYDKDVHYFAANTQLAPTTSINIDTSTVYGDTQLRESVAAAKSRIYMKDYQIGSSIQWNRSFNGDGNTRFFLLGQEPVSIDPSQMTATVNGTAVDLLVDFVDGSPGSTVGSSSQIFICFDNTGVRTSSGNAAFTSTQTLSVSYNYLQDTVSTIQSTAAQDELGLREGGDGIHEYAIADPSMTASDGSDDLASAAGMILLSRYAYPRVTGRMETFSSGWRAGQVFDITTTKRLGGFTDTFHVQQVTKRIVNHPSSAGAEPTFKTTIEFADGIVGI